MTEPREPHPSDVGAYVLGALDGPDARAFEAHLLSCADCRRAAEELSGLPALLARVPDDAVAALATGDAGTAAPPAGLLDGVLEQVGARGRRRRVVLTAAAAVVAVVAGLGGWLLLGGRDAPPPPGDVRVVALDAVDAAPMAATARLESVPWGTRITLECRYEATESAYRAPPTFSLLVDDGEGPQQVATWRAVPGRDVTVPGATALLRDDIESLEVRTSTGTRVLVWRSGGA